MQSYLFYAPILRAFMKEGEIKEFEVPPQDLEQDSIYIKAGRAMIQITNIAALLTLLYQTLL